MKYKVGGEKLEWGNWKQIRLLSFWSKPVIVQDYEDSIDCPRCGEDVKLPQAYDLTDCCGNLSIDDSPCNDDCGGGRWNMRGGIATHCGLKFLVDHHDDESVEVVIAT